MRMRNITGKTVALADDRGEESIMTRIPKFTLAEVIDGAPDTVHPAFIVDGEEKECIYVSKYQNVVRDGLAYSLPGEDPATLRSIEEADACCRGKGDGWHLMTSAEWAALALWSHRNGTLPRGNNAEGRDWSRPYEHGAVVSLDAVVPEGEVGPAMRVATGSGPASWSHDGTDEGVFDLNGNVWEMTSGLRLVDDYLEYVPDNDACRHSLDDAPWRRIAATDLSPIDPDGDTADALTFTPSLEEGGGIVYRTRVAAVKAGLPGKPDPEAELLAAFCRASVDSPAARQGDLLQQLCLTPPNRTEYHTDAAWGVTDGVRYPIRGGYWVNKEMAGIFSHGFYMTPSDKYFDVGFRSCYVE